MKNFVCAILSLFLLVQSQQSSAQKFQNGVVFKINGDSIVGGISIKKGSNRLRVIYFKNRNIPKIKLTPLEVKEFKLENGERFISRIVTSDKYPNGATNEIDTVFLQVLVQGQSSLMYFTDEYRRDHFYIIKVDSSAEELVVKTIVYKGRESEYNALDLYKGQLKAYFSSCPQLEGMIDKTSYREKSMQKTFVKEYQCLYSSEPDFVNTKKYILPEYGLVAGYSISEMKFLINPNSGYTGYSGDFAKYKFEKSQSLVVGAYLNLNFVKFKSFDWQHELWLNKFSPPSSTIIKNSSTTLTANVDYSYLCYKMGIRYTIGDFAIRPYVYMGGVMNFVLSDKSTVHKVFDSGISITESDYKFIADDYFQKFQFGFLGGVGFKVKKFGFMYRYEIAAGPLRAGQAVSSVINTSCFTVSYALREKKTSK